MCASFYDNQEATERSYMLLSLGALALNYGFLAFLFFYVSLQSEDEDRLFEEMQLDTCDQSLSFTLSFHKDKMLHYYSQKEQLYDQRSDGLHAYLADDYVYEREMLNEIFEFPLSIILSNNYYLIPSDERHALFFYNKIRSQLWWQFLHCRSKSPKTIVSLNEKHLPSGEKPLMRLRLRSYRLPRKIHRHVLRSYHFKGYSMVK